MNNWRCAKKNDYYLHCFVSTIQNCPNILMGRESILNLSKNDNIIYYIILLMTNCFVYVNICWKKSDIIVKSCCCRHVDVRILTMHWILNSEWRSGCIQDAPQHHRPGLSSNYCWTWCYINLLLPNTSTMAAFIVEVNEVIRSELSCMDFLLLFGWPLFCHPLKTSALLEYW